MTPTRLYAVLRHLRHVVDPAAPVDGTDGQLLDRFLHEHDEGAFERLLLRHGRMVLGVCRRVLGNDDDAADAFQATFLVLVSKATSIRKHSSLGSWLYGVASRLSLRMRATNARRRYHERQVIAMPTARTERPESTWDDVYPVLDEELSLLPEKYRIPLVLCYLEGKSHAQAAEELGWPRGSIAKRLTRGLGLLRQRLLRRGLTLAPGLLATLLVDNATAAVPTPLQGTVLRTATLVATGQAVAGVVSSKVAAALASALRELSLARLKLTGALLLLVVVAVGGGFAALVGKPAAEDPPQVPAPTADGAPRKPELDSDSLPQGAVGRLGTLRLRHGSPVTSVAFAPDGKLLASGSWDHTIRLWDAATGRLVRLIQPKEGWIWSVAFSPDGRLLATGGDHRGRKVRLWEVATGKCVATLAGHADAIHAVAFAPHGKTLVTACYDGTTRVWEIATEKELFQFSAGESRLNAAAFSPDGKLLATADHTNAVRLWDAATGNETGRLDAGQDQVVAVAFSPDGKLVAGGSLGGTVRVWEVAGAREVRRVRGRDLSAHSVAFAPDGKTFAAGYGDWVDGRRIWVAGEVTVWETASGKLLHRLAEHSGAVQAIAFSPDGRALAAGTVNGGVLLWDPGTGKARLRSAAHQASIRCLAFADPRTLVTTSSDRTVRVWDVTRKEQRLELGGGEVAGTALAVSPDRKQAAWGGLDGKVRVFDLASGREVRRFDGHTGPVSAVAFAPDGKVLASGGNDQTIRLYDLASGEARQVLKGHTSEVLALAFAPGGRLLASGDGVGGIRFWSHPTGQELGKIDGHTREVFTLVFSPDGWTLASSSRDESVRLWEVATGQVRWAFGTPRMGHAAVAYSPDGRLLLTACSQEQQGMRLWDLASGQELSNVWGHRGFVLKLAFSPDAKLAASASDDSTVLLWDVASLRHVKPSPALPTPSEVEARWRDLTGADAARAFQARGPLTAAPKLALPLLKQVLRPVAVADAQKVGELIAQLDNDTFTVREKAAAELEALDGAVEAELRKALAAATSAEVRQRLTRLLERWDGHPPSAERLHQGRALEVLELMGTEEARSLLRGLAKGAPEAWLTREARAALGRLEKR